MSPFYPHTLIALILAAVVLFGTQADAKCLQIPDGFEDSYKVVTILANEVHVVWYSEKYERIVITIDNCVVYVVHNIQTAKLDKAFRFYRDTR